MTVLPSSGVDPRGEVLLVHLGVRVDDRLDELRPRLAALPTSAQVRAVLLALAVADLVAGGAVADEHLAALGSGSPSCLARAVIALFFSSADFGSVLEQHLAGTARPPRRPSTPPGRSSGSCRPAGLSLASLPVRNACRQTASFAPRAASSVYRVQ